MPVAVSYLMGGMEPVGMTWPRSIRGLEEQVGRRFGTEQVIVVNDAVAFALGAIRDDPRARTWPRPVPDARHGLRLRHPAGDGYVSPSELNTLPGHRLAE